MSRFHEPGGAAGWPSVLRWAPALAWLALIHWVSGRPAAELPVSLPPGLDKAAHLCEFGLLAWLLWRPLRDGAPGWPAMKAAVWIFAFVALNGVLDELHQMSVPGRQAAAGDALADVLGGALALAWALHREKARLPRPA